MNLHAPYDVSLASNEVRYRSAHPTDDQSGGDDPIRTDGAFQEHSALAVRCHRPLGHVSMNLLVGMERFELSRAKALVSKTSVSPISTTSPRPTNSVQPRYTSSDQVPKHQPVDKMVSSQGLEP